MPSQKPKTKDKTANQPPKAPKLPQSYSWSEAANHYFMASVGQTFKKRRQQLGIGYESVTAETKILPKYLKAIENSAWEQIPHSVHMLGFVRQYARFLGLDGEVAATKYLLERGPLATAKPMATKKAKRTIVGTRVLVGIGVILAILVVAGYLLVQLSVLAAPPKLNITQPPNDVEVRDTSFEVAGETTPAASVSINGVPITVGDDGKFITRITLQEGLNTVRIESVNRAGKTARVERNILVRR